MTERYAVIGRPIAQSKSPEIHLAFAEATGQAIEYVRIEGVPGGFAAEVDRFRAGGGLGLNVTAPFKLDACAYAGWLHADARLAGAVNCLQFGAEGASGFNFDGVGLLRDLEANLGVALAGRRVLLLGAGGAARGALRPLLEARPAELVIVNRTVSRAEALAAAFPEGSCRAAGFEAVPGRFAVVVNATSASLEGAMPALPPGAFAPGCVAYDMTYGKGLTPFLQLAREAGAGRLVDGVGMLVEQAAEAFALWRGVRPATGPVIRRLTVPLV